MPKSQKTFYITAAIDYPNAVPHLGTAYEKIGCDMVARHRRLRGDEVRFTMGTDEHSQSVEREARRRGLEPADFCAGQAELFKALWDRFDIHPTAFVRTNDESHRPTTEWLLNKANEAGYIYKDWYRAWFCPSCERFYTDKEVAGGLCPQHERPVEWVEEENYFFKLSAFEEPLLELFEKQPDFLTPETRRNEVLNVIRGGLEDISISRSFSQWGFALPFDAGQVAYVWFDALPSYLTGIGFPDDRATFDRFWPCDVHVIGKDITRFHTVMWPAMLMAAGLPLPTQVHAHGFVTIGGQKMSKTRGIFVDPTELIAQYGSDAVRYVLLAEVAFDRDGDFSIESFIDRYNADLANDYGNLVSRTEKMVAKYFEGRVPESGDEGPLDSELRTTAAEVVAEYDRCMDVFDLSGALEAAQRLVGRANKYVEMTAPWKLAAAGDPRLATVCRQLLEAIRISTILLHPAAPAATARVAADLGFSLEGDQTEAVRNWGALTAGATVKVGDILFPRADRAEVLAAADA
jgi:methionyl-tRNA synthetase